MLVSNKLPDKQGQNAGLQLRPISSHAQKVKELMESVIVSQNPLSRQSEELNKMLKNDKSKIEKSLIYILENDTDSEVRCLAVQLLGKISTSDKAGTLMTTLKHDRDPKVRIAAAKALGLIGGDNAKRALVMSGIEDVSEKVKQEVTKVLFQMKNQNKK
jgi:HEAT repeat protein